MTRKLGVLVLTIFVLGSSVALCVPLKWTLVDANFNDGGVAFGSFVYDADTETYSNILVTTTAGSAFGGSVYQFQKIPSPIPQQVLVLRDSPTCTDPPDDIHSLSLFFGTPFLTNLGGTIPLFILPNAGSRENITQSCAGGAMGIRFLVSGFVIASGVAVEVEIDIKPGSDDNAVNPFARGVIPVAILGSDTLDVTEIDATTLAFGPSGATPKHEGHLEDANHDGLMDLVSHHRTEETGIEPGDTEVCMIGEFLDGTQLIGCDAILIWPS